MPNWAFNKVLVTGLKDDVEAAINGILNEGEVIEYLKTYMPEYLLQQGSIKEHGWTINALTKKFDNPREELKSWLVDFYKEVSLQYAKLAWLKENIEKGELK